MHFSPFLRDAEPVEEGIENRVAQILDGDTPTEVLILVVWIIQPRRPLAECVPILAHGEHGIVPSLRSDLVEDKCITVDRLGFEILVDQPHGDYADSRRLILCSWRSTGHSGHRPHCSVL